MDVITQKGKEQDPTYVSSDFQRKNNFDNDGFIPVLAQITSTLRMHWSVQYILQKQTTKMT